MDQVIIIHVAMTEMELILKIFAVGIHVTVVVAIIMRIVGLVMIARVNAMRVVWVLVLITAVTYVLMIHVDRLIMDALD
jgi:hypothetical protein